MSILNINSQIQSGVFGQDYTRFTGQKSKVFDVENVGESKRVALGIITNGQQHRSHLDRACKAKPKVGVGLNSHISTQNGNCSRKENVSQGFNIFVDNGAEIQERVLKLHDASKAESGKYGSDSSPMVVSPCFAKDEDLTCSNEIKTPKTPDAEYEDDIVKYLKEVSFLNRPRVGYMNKQPDINYNMRSVLVDWLIEVCEEFSLENQTLHLAVAYIDKFLSVMSVQRGKLQLVGTACLLIASKFEEIFPPDVSDFIYVTDDTYSDRQLLKMEQLILNTLNYNVSKPTALDFLEIFLVAAGHKKTTENSAEGEDCNKVRSLAMFLCELTLQDSNTFLKYLPAKIAASSVCLAAHTLGLPVQTEALRMKSTFELKDLYECVQDMQNAFTKAPTLNYQVVVQKYATERYQKVSMLTPRRINETM